MYPLTVTKLHLLELSEHWARDLPQHPVPDDVLDLLLQAVWRGELQACLPDVVGLDPDPRRRLLEACRLRADHPGLLFVDAAGDAPPAEVPLPDGSVEIDPRLRVVWAIASEGQTPAAFSAACHVLAEARFDAFSDLLKPILASLAIDRADFAAFCQTQKCSLPPFWFARGAARSLAGAAAQCRRWLRAEVAGGRKRLSKSGYLAEAQKRFRGLSQRSFAAMWEDVVPVTWKRSGRSLAHRTDASARCRRG